MMELIFQVISTIHNHLKYSLSKKGTIVNEELRNSEDAPMIENKIDLLSDCDVYIIDNEDTLETSFIPEEEKNN